MRRQTLVKLGLGLIALVAVPWLFLRTLQDTIAEPYAVDSELLSGWTLVQADHPAVWAVGLRPPPLFRAGLFDQLFDRTMASMTSPVDDVLPIVLDWERRGEFAALSPETIRQAADEAGLDRVRLEPVCMAVKRETFAGHTREFHFVVFEVPGVADFRRRLREAATMATDAMVSLADEERIRRARDPAGLLENIPGTKLDLILPIAGSDVEFSGWWPVVVDRETDCQAPFRS